MDLCVCVFTELTPESMLDTETSSVQECKNLTHAGFLSEQAAATILLMELLLQINTERVDSCS